jgi:hypothetical protein
MSWPCRDESREEPCGKKMCQLHRLEFELRLVENENGQMRRWQVKADLRA